MSVVNDLQQGIIAAGGVYVKEPTRLSPDGDRNRPDLQLVIGSQQILVDVTIRNPTSPTYYECRGGSAQLQLRSTVIAEQQKTAKYSTMAKAQGAKFLPFAVEMYGGMGKSAKQLLQLINKTCMEQSRKDSSKYSRHEQRLQPIENSHLQTSNSFNRSTKDSTAGACEVQGVMPSEHIWHSLLA